MAKSRSSRPNRRLLTDRLAYFEQTKRPLQILAFLLPLVIVYEISMVFLLRSERGVLTNKAHETLLNFFAAFGIPVEGSLYLGGVVVVVVLLTWHLLNRDPWRINYPALGLMAIESLLLALPLLVLGQLIRKAVATDLVILASSGSNAPLQGLGLSSEWALSVGAGLYEELMFRMLLIAVIHTLLVDVGKASHTMGASIAVFVSAAAFTAYHPLHDAADVAFYFLAGLYFGAIYVMRGFGIVVGAHALYDIITFTMLAPPHGG